MKIPELISVQSTVYHCSGCGRWVCRVPKFVDDMTNWQCEECGCTSVLVRDGRPFGKKSRQWKQIVEWFNYCYPLPREEMQFIRLKGDKV